MFQHARRGKQNAAPARVADVQPAAARSPGRRTLTEQLWVSPSDLYSSTIDAARREVEAVHAVALPAYRAALRIRDALEREQAVTRTAIAARHMLMTANQHVNELEKAMTFPNPLITFLRERIDSAIGRATKLGAYRGFENLVPQPHRDPPSLEYRAQEVAAFGKTAHAHAATSAAPTTAPATIRRPRATEQPSPPRRPMNGAR